MKRAGPILLATAVAGGAGYATIAIASVVLVGGDFLVFASLWASVFFVAGAVGGWQAEVTRASSQGHDSRLRPLGLAGVVIALVAVLIAVLWNTGLEVVGAEPGMRGALPAAVAAVGAVALGTLAGMASGAERWRLLCALLSAEGLLRFTLVTLVLIAHGGYGPLAAAMVAPAGLVSGVVALTWRRVGLGRVVVDGSVASLVRRAFATIAAATAMSVVVSALPAMITLGADHVPLAVIEGAQAVIQLARAPMVVLALAFQGYAVVVFRSQPRRALMVGAWTVGLAVVGGILALPAARFGPGIVDAVYGGHKVISAGTAAALVGSAPLLMSVFLVGAASLARGMHGTYVVTWAVVAAGTVALLLAPMSFEHRVAAAVVGPPLAGAAYGIVRLRLARSETKS